jgi:M6 family metalloprotease-like protein
MASKRIALAFLATSLTAPASAERLLPQGGTPAAASIAAAAPQTAPLLEDVRSEAIDSYVVQRGLRARAEAAELSRRRLESLPPDIALAAPIVGTAVAGLVEVPIVTVKFSDTAADPYPIADLQKELFDGPWPTGTMSDHYREMSGGKFTVTGEVFDWVALPKDDAFYAGPPGCNGICRDSELGDMLTTALQLVDADIDFTRFDNDGADNQPNSGDDDGFVDFVAFVHPETGGECQGNDNIWSHRFSLAALTGSDFVTADSGALGVGIMIDDYVVMPALACDGATMIQIGVFSHEFGHAFGLPDLYDARRPVESAGIGGWGLMGSGSWGGDGTSAPERPSHMEAWSKEFLGWVSPKVIESDETGIRITPVQNGGNVIRVDYSASADPEDKKYLLLEYRTQQGFDASLPTNGLLVTEIDNTRVESGLINNTVNDSALQMGVNIIEADSRRDLDKNTNRADAGDLFPGATNIAAVDAAHPEKIGAALCNIVQTTSAVTLDIFVSRTTCPGSLEPVAVSPAEVAAADIAVGKEIVVEGILSNKGTNYFTDRQLVISGEGGGELAVSAPAPLSTAQSGTGTGTPENLSDLLDKKVLLRGRLERELRKGEGLTEVFVVEEYQVAE